MPDCANVRNPGSAASSLYGPNGRLGKTYSPASFETVILLIPVSVCVAVISTPGSTAPLGSWTVPLIWAVACAHALLHVIKETNRPGKRPVKIRFISPSLLPREGCN